MTLAQEFLLTPWTCERRGDRLEISGVDPAVEAEFAKRLVAGGFEFDYLSSQESLGNRGIVLEGKEQLARAVREGVFSEVTSSQEAAEILQQTQWRAIGFGARGAGGWSGKIIMGDIPEADAEKICGAALAFTCLAETPQDPYKFLVGSGKSQGDGRLTLQSNAMEQAMTEQGILNESNVSVSRRSAGPEQRGI